MLISWCLSTVVAGLLLHISCTVALGPFEVTDGCEVTKGCFLDPPGCTGAGCNLAVTYTQTGGDETDFQIMARDTDYQGQDFYVAVGISQDEYMGDDSVLDCKYYGGSVRVGMSWNIKNAATKSSDPLTDPLAAIDQSVSSGTYADGFLICNIRRVNSIIGGEEDKVYDLTSPNTYHILIARGAMSSTVDGAKSYHGADKIASVAAVDFFERFSVGAGKSRLLQAHGCLMVLAWAFFAGIGIINARYRQAAAGVKLSCGVERWFVAHRTFMVLAVVCTIAGVVCVFTHVGGWSDMAGVSSNLLKAHPLVGGIVTLLALINPGLALCRPHKDSSKRFLFNWTHRLIGTAALLLAMLNMMMGIMLPQVSGSITSDWMLWLIVILVVVHVTVEMLLLCTSYACCGDSQNVDISGKPIQNSSKSLIESSIIMLYVLFCFFIVVAVIGGMITA